MPPFDVDDNDMALIVAGGVGFVALLEGDAHALLYAMETIERRGGEGKLLAALETITGRPIERTER